MRRLAGLAALLGLMVVSMLTMGQMSSVTEPTSSGATPPSDTSVLWMDTDNDTYYRYSDAHSRWVSVDRLFAVYTVNSLNYTGALKWISGNSDSSSAYLGFSHPDSCVIERVSIYAQGGSGALDESIRVEDRSTLLLGLAWAGAEERDTTGVSIVVDPDTRISVRATADGAVRPDRPTAVLQIRQIGY